MKFVRNNRGCTTLLNVIEYRKLLMKLFLETDKGHEIILQNLWNTDNTVF